MTDRDALDVRSALASDVEALCRIEEAAFPGDRLTRRAFRHALQSPSIVALVAATTERVEGYCLVETRRGSTLARLTSIAVAPEAGRRGTGRRLVGAAEAASAVRGCDRLRLEVRADNVPALRLYEAGGYRERVRLDDYYEDGMAARRFEKRLTGRDAAAGTC